MSKLKLYGRYLWSFLQHKWFVFRAGRMAGVPLWRLVVHDWQKLTPWEFAGYALYTRDKADINPERAIAYAYAWLHHENTAPHHWGYWIPRSGPLVGRPLPMPETYVREMIADWHGASRAYVGTWDITDWLRENGPRMKPFFHSETVATIERVMWELGYQRYDDGGQPILHTNDEALLWNFVS